MNGPAESEEDYGTEAKITSVRPACVNALLAVRAFITLIYLFILIAEILLDWDLSRQ